MIDWELVKKEYEVLSQKLSDSSLDKKERKELQRRFTQFSELLDVYERIIELEKNITDNKKQLMQADDEMKVLFEEEIETDQKKLKKLNQELEELLYPADEKDERAAFLEIRAGAGGQEASLFAGDLLKMYTNYALSKGWEVSVVDSHSTEVGGFKEIILHIKGKNVYKHLKFESGVHRVQRVPKTEASGRIHTSTVTVAVLPEVDEVDFDINPQDLRIDVFRASGAGGQHVNTTDSAVRITHIPTGVVVSCQDERSQIKNKAKAMKVLRARLLEAEQERKEAEMGASRKEQVGMGQRAEKVRTYNFPQNRITDHRINLTLKKLDIVLQGNLDDLIDPLIEWDVAQRHQKSLLEN
ncbi:MAG: peptide chain release factor 1 [bacterium]